ncbi:MAG: hypothetical protein JWM64_1152, partial [Frankiales bacterium]|nr:hypothetical protein [Frankiales bacterium]
ARPGAAGTSTTAAGPACGPLSPTDQGVTAKTITVGVVVVDLGSASGLINLPSSADVRKAYGAVLDAVNKAGGVRCRKVVAKYYTDNVFDTSSEHAACLQMQQDKVFAAFNNLFNTTEQTCLAKAGIPNIWYTTPHTPDVRKYAPYILSWHPHYDQLIKHYVRGSQSQGWFKGMKKLGILEASCYPDEGVALRKELKSIGVDPGGASVFNYGCGAQTQMADQQQAASLQFKRDGVTHVMDVAYSASSGFSAAADQQAYDPEFTHMEDASATAIETGAQNTAGYQYNGSTQECSRILKGAGLPAPYAEPSALYFGVACVNLQMFKAMAEKAPELKRNQMALGLSRVGAMELSFPAGPGNFRDASLPTGGQNWRPARWATACNCWKVVDTRYRPGY